jgi:site-specific DNA-methyltransferase (adenine-specific)
MYQILVRDDCTEAMKRLPDGSVHSVVCDPPYHLTSIVKRFGKEDAAPVKVPEGGTGAYARASKGFMGKTWDGGDVAFRVETWQEVYRVLKPGGHLLAFGGTRTYHRMACAIEDAGFEIRDSIHYTYGSGFPKSHNVAIGIDKAAGAMGHRGKRVGVAGNEVAGDDVETARHVPEHEGITDEAKAWKGWGTALKPAHEIIVVARKPLDGTVAANCLKHGTGAFNIDTCRVGFVSEADMQSAKPQGKATAKSGALAGGTQNENEREEFEPEQSPLGRWPANVLLSHDVNCSGESGCAPGCPCAIVDEQSGGDGASRYFNVLTIDADDFAPFFYCSKASRKEREAGLADLKEGDKKVANDHPTVKSLALMEWCVKLVTPPEGVVLDPFMGSGSTGIAALRNGFSFIGMEADEHYMDIAEARIRHHGGEPEVLR